MTEINEIVTYLVKLIIDNPNDVKVREKQGEQISIFEIHVNKQDFGKLLGKQGRNIQAIRTLVTAISAKAGKRSTIEVIEPEE
jgi:predicted RNA-binding protein YlqC (UPF0109 family)